MAHRPRPSQSAPPPRQRQETPEDLVHGLLATIRGQFCADLTIQEWYQHQSFLRRNVVLWPARFMLGKGFTIPAERYESIMRGIFRTIIEKGQPGAVKYWPGYLMKCVQEHWRHHWEEYYQDSKSTTNLVAQALLAGKSVIREDKTVEALAMAHQVLTARRKKTAPISGRISGQKQLSLFG